MKIILILRAYGDLLKKYIYTFKHFFQQRHSYKSGLFFPIEAEFLPSSLSVQERPISPSAIWTGRLIVFIFFSAVIWAYIGKTDVVINASGKILPSARVKSIASIEVASVRSLHVDEGQHVKAGDVLVELDSRMIDADRDKALAGYMDAMLNNMSTKALVVALNSSVPYRKLRFSEIHSVMPWLMQSRLDQENVRAMQIYNEFHEKLVQTEKSLFYQERYLDYSKKTADDYKTLLTEGDVSEHAWREKEENRIVAERQLQEIKNQYIDFLSGTKKQLYEKIADSSRISEETYQEYIKSNSRSNLQVLKSPVDGTIQQLAIHTIGGVVPAAQSIMQIVPDEKSIEIEAQVENKDVGFLQVGQSVQVKINAFEYTKFGTVPGTLSRLATDAVVDEKRGLLFPMKISLDKSNIMADGIRRKLSPGMTVDVEIKIGERRLIEYILSPILHHKRESLHEN